LTATCSNTRQLVAGKEAAMMLLRTVRGAVLALLLIGLAEAPAAWAQSTVSGRFTTIWGDPVAGGNTFDTYVLVDAAGSRTKLVVDPAVLRALGGPVALNLQQVTVTGQRLSGFAADAMPSMRADAIQIDPMAVAAQAATSASRPFVTLLCQFADSPGVTRQPSDYEAIMGNTYPGMADYFREQSNGQISLAGSLVVGWLRLPRPRADYVEPYGPYQIVKFDRAFNDCTALAQSMVAFHAFHGINLVFSESIGSFNYGGTYVYYLDGGYGAWGVTWLDTTAPLGEVAHEMGHAFGMVHSHGPGQYDSKWDVMSAGGRCDCVPPHTIAYNKDLVGWIPAERKYVAHHGTVQTILIQQSAQPPDGWYLMAQIPLIEPIFPIPVPYYTLEARRFVGYDHAVPGEAIVIHRVDPAAEAPAQVVDADGAVFPSPNDEGAMWRPGETFVDSDYRIVVSVDYDWGTGYIVTIANDPADLLISTLSAPDSAAPGASITVSDTTQNTGGTEASTTTTRFYLSRDQILDASDLLLGSRTVPRLAPRESSAGSTTLTLPTGLAPGMYYVIAVADGLNSVFEWSESNNTAVAALGVGPDLTVSALSAPPIAAGGATIAVTDTTTNALAIAGPSTTRFSLIPFLGGGISQFRSIPLGSRAVPALRARASSTATTFLTIPSDTPAGRYQLVARADGDQVATESDESNNSRSVLLTVAPDLVVSALSAPGSARSGTTITITDTTLNQGSATGATTTRFYLSVDTALDGTDVQLASRSVPGLGAGATSTGSVTVTLTVGRLLFPRTYYIIAKADADGAISESDEGNNTAVAAITISP